MLSAQNCVDQLNAFADANSVKEFLKLMGVRGYRNNSESCPISTWIGSATMREVSTEDTIKVYHRIETYNFDDLPFDEYEISSAVKDFIDKFDNGLFEELDIERDDEEEGGYEITIERTGM